MEFLTVSCTNFMSTVGMGGVGFGMVVVGVRHDEKSMKTLVRIGWFSFLGLIDIQGY